MFLHPGCIDFHPPGPWGFTSFTQGPSFCPHRWRAASDRPPARGPSTPAIIVYSLRHVRRTSQRAAVLGSTRLYYLPVTTRVPLKFGPEVLTEVICARARVTRLHTANSAAPGDSDRRRRLGGNAAQRAVGVAERPLLRRAAGGAARPDRVDCPLPGPKTTVPAIPMEIGHRIHHHPASRDLLAEANQYALRERAAIPWLAALGVRLRVRPRDPRRLRPVAWGARRTPPTAPITWTSDLGGVFR